MEVEAGDIFMVDVDSKYLISEVFAFFGLLWLMIGKIMRALRLMHVYRPSQSINFHSVYLSTAIKLGLRECLNKF